MTLANESRIAPAEAPWPESVQARFQKLTPLRLFRVLARDERLFARFVDGGFLDRGHLSLRERELAILTVCARCRSEYEWGGRDALVVRLCDALQDRCDIAEEFWTELRANFSEMALLELLLLIGKYRQVCILTNALALEPEKDAPRFPPAP
jgi:alkylhydroperoxidase family enzyme